MRHIELFDLLCIVQNTLCVYFQDGFGPVDFSTYVLLGEFLVLPNRNQQHVRLCRRQASQSSQRVEGYCEIVEDRRG